MELLQNAIDFVRTHDLQEILNLLAAELGPWTYLLLFAIIFCETGLVVTPFLPGDSLLLAVGAVAAIPGSPLSLPLLLILLFAAAICGDNVNYWIGYRVGPRVFSSEKSRLFNKNYLLRAQEFYEKHGGKAIVLARFVPIIRTFAPFVAGIGKMNYRWFLFFSVTGGAAWVLIFVLGGYAFGTLPVVKRNFHLVIFAVIFVSLLPPIFEAYMARRRRLAEAALPVESK
jgi:membrane-associated protein